MEANELAQRLPEHVYAVLSQLPGRLFVAGGWPRDIEAGVEPKDIDLFAVDDQTLQTARRLLSHELGRDGVQAGTCVEWEPEDDLTVQLVESRTGEPDEVVRSFDFHICQIALWHNGAAWQRFVTRQYSNRAPERMVTWTGKDTYPGSSLRRLVRLAARGFLVPDETIRDVAERLISSAKEKGDDAILAQVLKTDSQ